MKAKESKKRCQTSLNFFLNTKCPLSYILVRFISALILITASQALADSKQEQMGTPAPLREQDGRQFVPRGFVLVQQDSIGPIEYTQQDYQRMIRCGANVQVIRLSLGNFGGWPGTKLNEDFLRQADRLVLLGRQAGFKTAFKMTVYFTPGFKWEKFWLNHQKEQDYVLKAWQVIWNRYKNDPSVFAYDLLNEPGRGEFKKPFNVITGQHLVPFYRRLIDEMHKISPDKWAMYQPLVIKPGEPRGPSKLPVAEMNVAIGRDHLIYAPHGYFPDPKQHEIALKQHIRDAAISDASLVIGEWIRRTYKEMDSSIELQNQQTQLYEKISDIYDEHAVGMIKAWFLGTRKWLQAKENKNPFTWSVFSDTNVTGMVERKYIMDIIARPAPLTIDGQIEKYHYDPATRIFSVSFTTNRKFGDSEIFVGQNRHYPDGFTVVFNDSIQMGYNPLCPQVWMELESSKLTDKYAFDFDEKTQRLRIKKWPGNEKQCVLKILPGISEMSNRTVK